MNCSLAGTLQRSCGVHLLKWEVFRILSKISPLSAFNPVSSALWTPPLNLLPISARMRSIGRILKAAASLLLLSASPAFAQNSSESLPVVDLGYELYRATEFNVRAKHPEMPEIRAKNH